MAAASPNRNVPPALRNRSCPPALTVKLDVANGCPEEEMRRPPFNTVGPV